jgi:hypothetical protein
LEDSQIAGKPFGDKGDACDLLGTWSNGRNSPRGFMVEKSGLSGSSDIWPAARRNRMGTCNFSRVSLLAARTKFVRAGWAGENHDEIPTHGVMLGHGEVICSQAHAHTHALTHNGLLPSAFAEPGHARSLTQAQASPWSMDLFMDPVYMLCALDATHTVWIPSSCCRT